MHSLDLNPLVKEADLLKQAAEILEGSKANTSGVCFKIMVQVEEMKEGLQALKILLGKEEAQLETCKVWWNFLNFKSFFLYQISIPCLDLIRTRHLIMKATLLLHESIILRLYSYMVTLDLSICRKSHTQ
jgi:hypothetical protein